MSLQRNIAAEYDFFNGLLGVADSLRATGITAYLENGGTIETLRCCFVGDHHGVAGANARKTYGNEFDGKVRARLGSSLAFFVAHVFS